jgi:NAD(P)-dependent dehydrogenase (short-subunit alcohol dehydrogenase family)
VTRRALIVGSGDGIGLALSRRLLRDGWSVVGVSRGPGRVDDPGYDHVVLDVTDPDYRAALAKACDGAGRIDLCVYCAGIGEPLRVDDLAAEARVFAVNLMGAVATVEVVVPRMVEAGGGHVIGLSSLADDLLSPDVPSYAASKAGLSSYLRSLAFALRPHGVAVTNVRFGFVDTKMAKAATKPMLISADQAAEVLMRCVRTRPVQVSYPRRMAGAVGVLRRLGTLRVWRG